MPFAPSAQLRPGFPALILAPMQGVTDRPMRELLGEWGGFSFCVTEYLRVSEHALSPRVVATQVPEVRDPRCATRSGLPVQVQLLGGDPERLGVTAAHAVAAGARAIDLNFGCPAPTVNRHDGGASLLRHPTRIREIVAAVRAAIPQDVPVSAKLRLGWDSCDPIHENAEMAAQGGAAWLTIHARTRMQGYTPPVFWDAIGAVRRRLALPVVANGDIWTLDDFRRCREVTGSEHFMLGRGALADPWLIHRVARELGLPAPLPRHADAGPAARSLADWLPLLQRFTELALEAYTGRYGPAAVSRYTAMRMKQLLRHPSLYHSAPWLDMIKHATTTEAVLEILRSDRATPAI